MFGDVYLSGNADMKNSISCHDLHTTNTLSSGYDDGFVLNFKQISALIDEIVASKVAEAAVSAAKIPFLTMIFSDHPIDNGDWLSAGSQVQLSDHAELSNWLFGADSNGWNTLPKLGTYKYQKDGGDSVLTLPSCDTYPRFTMDAGQAGARLSSSAPEITGQFGQLPSSAQTLANGSFKKLKKQYLGPNDGTKGNRDWTIDFYASRSSKVYGRYSSNQALSGEIVPETTKFIAYYYVG